MSVRSAQDRNNLPHLLTLKVSISTDQENILRIKKKNESEENNI